MLVCNIYLLMKKLGSQCNYYFLGLGGGWGYSGHSVEAIRFSVDSNILLVGFGLFGGRGEYTVKLKVTLICCYYLQTNK